MLNFAAKKLIIRMFVVFYGAVFFLITGHWLAALMALLLGILTLDYTLQKRQLFVVRQFRRIFIP